MATKPIKFLELQYTMAQFLINDKITKIEIDKKNVDQKTSEKQKLHRQDLV